MILCFELSMPNRNSWNGGWSGDRDYFAKVVNFGRTKKAAEKAKEILTKGYFHYHFGDGWSAAVKAKEVTPKEAAKARRKSRGFCGYDWMVESIKNNLEITT